MRTLTTRRVVPAVLLAACLVPLGGGSSSSAAAETCQGETATIVGTPGGDVAGTEGRDVVVSNRASTIDTLGGDDLVCVTGDRGGRVSISTGPGDDDVRVLGRTAVAAGLGDGEDTFVGGPFGDYAYGGWSDDEHEFDVEYDQIDAGGGYDHVTGGDCNNTFIADDLDLGPGGGEVLLLGHGTLPGADIDGGPEGRSSLRTACSQRGPWTVDNTDPDAGTAVGPDAATFRWSGFVTFGLGLDGLTFRGGELGESLQTYGAVDIDMGGGDDELVMRRSSIDEEAEARGGTGHDALTLVLTTYLSGDVVIDVRRGAATFNDAPPVGFAGFERHGGTGDGVEVLGTSGADDLFGTSCDLTIRGGAGADVIRALDPLEGTELCPGRTQRVLMGGDAGDRLVGSRQTERMFGGTGADTAYAGPGADRVQGDGGNDVLNGGLGRDTVLGGAGRDVCREAETRRGCER